MLEGKQEVWGQAGLGGAHVQVDARGKPRCVAQHLIELPVGAHAVQAGGPPQLRRQVQLRGEDAPLRVDLVELAARLR